MLQVLRWLSVVVLFIAPSGYAEPLQVVAHGGAATVEMDVKTLRAIFTMRIRHWSDGAPITVLVLPNSNPTHQLFCKDQLHLFPHQLQSAWDRLVYSGTGAAPEQVDTVEDMLQALLDKPGAIGYVEGVEIDERLRPIEIR